MPSSHSMTLRSCFKTLNEVSFRLPFSAADAQGGGDLALGPALLLEVPGLATSCCLPIVGCGVHAWQSIIICPGTLPFNVLVSKTSLLGQDLINLGAPDTLSACTAKRVPAMSVTQRRRLSRNARRRTPLTPSQENPHENPRKTPRFEYAEYGINPQRRFVTCYLPRETWSG